MNSISSREKHVVNPILKKNMKYVTLFAYFNLESKIVVNYT
jgi:hypothetical protein